MNSPIEISVVICAYTEERWADIEAAINSIRRQTDLPKEIILVIDHNPQLLERAQRAYPDLIVTENREPRGLSGARNSGIAASSGEVIAFLDDDAIATPGWLHHLCQWLQNSKVMGAGGIVVPNWEGGQPAWFPIEFNWVVGCSYQGLPQKTATIRNLFGGCMCVRREVFAEIGGFRTGIGRDEKKPMGCEETELCIRANQRWPDRLFLYEPLALAYHRVPASRGTWHYFRRRCYAEGLSKALVTQAVGTKDGLAAERTYTFYTLPRGVLKNLGQALSGDVAGLARAGAIIGGLFFTATGYLVGRFKQANTKLEPVTTQV